MLHANINNAEKKILPIKWYFAVTPEKMNGLLLEI